MNVPENLMYTEDHVWVKIEGEEASAGITDFAQDKLGDIIYVDIGTEGESVEFSEVFGTVESVKTDSDLFMPVTGEVLKANPKLADEPELVNSDPYGEGWMVKIKVTAQGDKLLSAESYKELIGK